MYTHAYAVVYIYVLHILFKYYHELKLLTQIYEFREIAHNVCYLDLNNKVIYIYIYIYICVCVCVCVCVCLSVAFTIICLVIFK